ncbi:2-hydroxyacyl-CoA dehydratase [Thermodesulfobacteriota bacterium]
MNEAGDAKNQPAPLEFHAVKTHAAVHRYMSEWTRMMKERVSRGTPLVVADIMTPHEILEAMDIPFILRAFGNNVFEKWLYPGLFAGRENVSGPEILEQDNYNVLNRCRYCSKGWENLWKLPQVSALILDEGACTGITKATEHWVSQYDAPVFRLAATATAPFYARYPRWWENMDNNWNSIIEPQRLDYRVEELKALIAFLENTTGKTLCQNKLIEVMELVNEQQMYFKKARDLIASTVPCPAGILDQIHIYRTQWHRGTPEARDLAKLFYEELKEKAAKGEGVSKNEQIRLQWVKQQYTWFGEPYLYQHFSQKYGAVFVCSIYISVGADGYARNCLDDPLRALASRHVFLGLYAGPEWEINEARRHNVKGAVMLEGSCPSPHGVRRMTKMAYKKAGIPILLIRPPLSEEKVIAEISSFIETLL